MKSISMPRHEVLSNAQEQGGASAQGHYGMGASTFEGLVLTRQWVPEHAVEQHLAAGWSVVWLEAGGAHPVVRPRGALLQRTGEPWPIA